MLSTPMPVVLPPQQTKSPPTVSLTARPSTAVGNSSAASSRKAGHSPTPSTGSLITPSPSTTSLHSLTLTPSISGSALAQGSSSSLGTGTLPPPPPTPSTISGASNSTLSSLKSRLSTKHKGKRSFTSSVSSQKISTSVISPPALTAPIPPLKVSGKPPLRTQKSVDNLFTRSSSREHFFAGGGPANLPPPSGSLGVSSGAMAASSAGAPLNMYDTVHEVASKRIATLDYLRRAHEGRVFWFKTVLFTKADLASRVHQDHRKLARRATNHFILGQSVPSILDLGASNPLDYLKAFSSLLTEYESFQASHPADGVSSSATGGRVGMRKLWTRTSSSKPRRGSSATQGGIDGLYHFSGLDSLDKLKSGGGNSHHHFHHIGHGQSTPSLQHSSSTASDDFSGEEYVYLVHSSLPFEPDYYETFATLCDVLIDAYTRVLSLVSSPSNCGIGVGETFLKADAKVRKLVVSGVVKEFEEASRAGIKSEVNSLAKSVLGGMI